MTRKALFAAVALLMLLCSSYGPTGRASTLYQGDSRTFPETGHTVSGKFLKYWQEHGGLAQQGFPISEEFQETNDTDGKTYTVQYFERAVFEMHPENRPPHDVLLSLLGSFEYKRRYANAGPSQSPNTSAGSMLFRETGKRLGGVFLTYWRTHGGLAQQGYPITDEMAEVSELDGKTYTMQYFERAVFERHPEKAGTQYEVLLSQLGTFRYRARYTSVAQAYLQEALDFIQENTIVRDLDWTRIREEAGALAKNARTTKDTYPSIRHALQSLKDAHSRFLDPSQAQQTTSTKPLGIIVSYAGRRVASITKGGLAEEAGVRVGDVIEVINGQSTQDMNVSSFFAELYSGIRVELQLRRQGEASPVSVAIAHEIYERARVPSGKRLAGGVGYIYVPAILSSFILDEYGSIMHEIIRDIDQTPACGWVVDLQTNVGGSLSPMVLGVGPILGNGIAGTFIDARERRTNWAYQDGSYLIGDSVFKKVDNPYQLKNGVPPVAVLTSSRTASAGEATLISFRGRPQARTFGEPTFGVPNGVGGKTMSDGAVIALASALEADRTGRVYAYNENIQPDQPARIYLPGQGTDDDPVLQAALEWLRSQPSCSR